MSTTGSPTGTSVSPRVASAVEVSRTPTIDGILDEAVWEQAKPLADFIQAEPFEGQPGSETTEVRLLYDSEAIYVGVICHDRNPSLIVTTDSRRDAALGEMDSFQMIFDTFRDQQNGFVFGTNAAGLQYDAQVRDQGNQTASWDGSWEVRTRTTDAGWTAEFRIPLRTLRYGPPPQVWGVNFFRNIQDDRNDEGPLGLPIARYTIPCPGGGARASILRGEGAVRLRQPPRCSTRW